MSFNTHIRPFMGHGNACRLYAEVPRANAQTKVHVFGLWNRRIEGTVIPGRF